MSDGLDLVRIVDRCQIVMAHAWMVRTFVKHSEEVENFPELMHLVRAVFDVSRALETRLASPTGYLQMLRKKLGKLRAAAEQFRIDAPAASSHMNFLMAVISMDACVAELTRLLADGQQMLPPPAPRTGPALPRSAESPATHTNSVETDLPENHDSSEDHADI